MSAIGDLLGPAQAEAAPWPEVLKLLTKAAPQEIKALDKGSLAALERLTEAYPSVKGTRLGQSEFSRWHPPGITGDVSDWVRGKHPGGYGDIFVTTPLDYAHEGSHAFGGPLHNWAFAGLGMGGQPRAVLEGFAEGSSHGLLDRFGKLADAPYWRESYKAAEPRLQQPYLKAGTLCRDVGSDIRSGKTIDQESVINELLQLIDRYKQLRQPTK